MNIGRNIEELELRIGRACGKAGRSRDEVTVIAATKTVAPVLLRQAYEAGVMNFGENRVQEARGKIAEVVPFLNRPPTWHMIGHLQTNKAKTAVEIFDIIHSIDSLRLAEHVNEHVGRGGFPVLLEVNVAGELRKSGFPVTEVPTAVESISRIGNLEVKGLMTIAPLVADAEEVRPVFRKLRQLRDSLDLEHLSMGMTDDFEVAIEEGATMVRIGRAIFGERR
jgi:pyridoxal phosphate enzyme (YggS family)